MKAGHRLVCPATPHIKGPDITNYTFSLSSRWRISLIFNFAINFYLQNHSLTWRHSWIECSYLWSALILATVANEKILNIFDSACQRIRDPGAPSGTPDHRLQNCHATASFILFPCINISHHFCLLLYDNTNYNDTSKTLSKAALFSDM